MDPTDEQIRNMADRAHKDAIEILDGQTGIEFPQSFQTTTQDMKWRSFLIAEINYYWGMSEGMFTQMFLDEFDRLPKPSENEVRYKCAESYQDDLQKGAMKRADIKHEREKNKSRA